MASDPIFVALAQELPDRALTRQETQLALGVGRTKFWEMVSTGAFDVRPRIYAGCKRWLASEVAEWLRRQAQG